MASIKNISNITKSPFIKKISIALIVFVALYWLGQTFYTRLDLTEDKRYTLTPASIALLEEVTDTIRFSVYLEGNLPLSFSKMKREVSDMLNEIKRVSGGEVEIKFIDPSKLGEGKKSLEENLQGLKEYGLKPYTIQENSEEGSVETQYVIPGMIISTIDQYVPVNLLHTAIGNTTDERIHNAIQQLEYSCLKSIKQLVSKNRKNIAFLGKNSLYSGWEMYDINMSLLEGYNVDYINTRELLDSISKYKLLIIPQPKFEFTDADKYIIDQFVMQGGNLMYVGDNAQVNVDSLQIVSHTTAYPRILNNSDLLFNFGARINYDIILDKQCASIPMNIAAAGEQPRFEAFPWYYYPLLRPNAKQKHLITTNIDVVKAEFCSSIDTLEGNGNITKNILLTSTSYARTIGVPVPVGFSIIQINPNSGIFGQQDIPAAVLFEGDYKSLYATRSQMIPFNELPKGFKHTKTSKDSKVIVISDGNIMRNEIEVKGTDTLPKPLHYYKYFGIEQRTYTGNKEFLLNAVNYLCGDSELLTIRSREMKIRLLNKTRIEEERGNWKMFNLILPIVLVVIGGLLIFIIRKRKYAKKYVS